MTHTRLQAVVTAGAFSIAIAACGSSGSRGLSRSELITKANAICSTARTAVNAIPTPSSFQDALAAGYFDRLTPIVDKETVGLKALKPDSSVSADWNAFVALRLSQTSLLDTVRHKADTKDPSSIRDLQTAQAGGKQLTDAAGKFGADGCAK
jgi:hypothetical protein